MSASPFAELVPAVDTRHVAWVVDSLVPPPAGGVAFRVPDTYAAILRIHHRLDGETWSTTDDRRDLRTAPEPPHPLPDELEQVAGELGDSAVDALIPVLLAATRTPEHVHFAQWAGWGDHHRGAIHAFVESCSRVDWWGGRTMFLFDGPIEAVAAIGSMSFLPDETFFRRCPQWWWPSDRSWFVATEIDDPCSYVAGDEALIRAVERLDLDVGRVRSTDRW